MKDKTLMLCCYANSLDNIDQTVQSASQNASISTG